MSEKLDWQDLDKPLSVFTVRNAEMMNLNNGEPVQYYSANTKLVMVQKLALPSGTYYRTKSAKENSLNWAFKATVLGLPDEPAPLAHTSIPPISRTTKQTSSPKKPALESGERRKQTLIKRLKRFLNR